MMNAHQLRWHFEWRVAAIQNGIRDALAYRGDFILDFVGQAIVPVGVQLILWNSIFKTSGNSSLAGMSYAQLMAYTWTSILFSQVRGGNYDFGLIELIRTGGLNNYILRPVGVIEFTFFRGLGEKLFTASVCMFLGMIATFFTSMTLTNLILGMMLAILGNLIHYLFGSALAAVAFYWENAFAILMVKNMAVSLLSGELIPLSIVPPKYSWIWESTPFYLYVYGPTQIALGKWDHTMWAHQMGIGLLWVFGFWAMLKISWSVSMKHYQGMGG